MLTKGSELLLIRRAAGIAKGGYWCFPGGHVEPGETSRRALRRELAEELGIEVVAERRVGSLQVHDSRHVLVAWLASHVGGDFRPRAEEIADVRWMAPATILSLTLGLPSNRTVLQLLGVVPPACGL
ncbi:MAG: NUDIX domain-containing protein [Planctomycetes bacterium]|nr:NUDIX domain-containing protein [Planctomycetota bacterium]